MIMGGNSPQTRLEDTADLVEFECALEHDIQWEVRFHSIAIEIILPLLRDLQEVAEFMGMDLPVEFLPGLLAFFFLQLQKEFHLLVRGGLDTVGHVLQELFHGSFRLRHPDIQNEIRMTIETEQLSLLVTEGDDLFQDLRVRFQTATQVSPVMMIRRKREKNIERMAHDDDEKTAAAKEDGKGMEKGSD